MKKQNKLGAYLAMTAGIGCAASLAEGAVFFYGEESANDTNPDPAGIRVSKFNDGKGVSPPLAQIDGSQTSASTFRSQFGSGYFTQGEDNVGNGTGFFDGLAGVYFEEGFTNGAQRGDQNFINIDFDGDLIFEAVAQFNLDGEGFGYLIAIGTTNEGVTAADLAGLGGGAALPISEGVTLIANGGAVPEPSSLTLLALGASGLLTRRNRKKAA